MHDFKNKTDEELLDWLDKWTITINQDQQVVITELEKRSIDKLKKLIDSFSSSSERYSKRILFLTWVLVVLTIVLVIIAL
ncbi:hypothetical protein COU23_00655 [Candidatus Kuenenbacteria bacterium CG10_big_fil_rev_8_21_14_0_10_36_11]|uniref:Uncharacterized protein n=1 Tax=Candidatus Kuenenbacteria bacterium CG10_big_fil_rev_8_21_14_0_10_36_11 TaxID=1974618 RepID=A0A2M6WB47_9BACT|nr:MAG: hypothetical protein COU23_00655 [Candidatus Kuenenbacteria bacterium CG10_big_fil_rev_8_21_14_0_10_36_11]